MPSLFTEIPSWVIEVTTFDCEPPKATCVPVVESVNPLESTVIAPLDPLVELIRLNVPLAPEVITLAVTPRSALLIAVTRPANVAGVPPEPTLTEAAAPPPTEMLTLPERASFDPIVVVVPTACAG